MSDNRRQHERFELLAEVQLHRSGEVETFVTINISAGGLLVRNDSNVTVEIGEKVRIRLDASELAPPFETDATVVRIVAPGTKPGLLAFMWTSSDPAASAALGQMLWNLHRT